MVRSQHIQSQLKLTIQMKLAAFLMVAFNLANIILKE